MKKKRGNKKIACKYAKRFREIKNYLKENLEEEKMNPNNPFLWKFGEYEGKIYARQTSLQYCQGWEEIGDSNDITLFNAISNNGFRIYNLYFLDEEGYWRI